MSMMLAVQQLHRLDIIAMACSSDFSFHYALINFVHFADHLANKARISNQQYDLTVVATELVFTATTKLNLRLLITAISFFHAVVVVGVVVAIVFTARAELYHNLP
ncbi:hypothetical protein HID58_087357 [Brassica napus]|uniref:Uncharacterized protein n=1 Tax=Brassica napus TaxID=3708 RepID=A0ABQ7XT47_BRANA|nr:hypothetical protein HID58_087357 [Brassica napus]